MPYSATVLPLRGVLPAGSTFQSPDDGTLQASVLATHDDGSAALVVVAGTFNGSAGQSGTVRLQATTAASSAALTPAAISARVSNVAIDFGSYGTAQLSDFSTPERVWWANGRVICARYRVPAPNPGSTALEAVIDIHAYADRALVEVVAENCRFDAAVSQPATPAAASYGNAVVSVNGSTVATVNGNGAPEGRHSFSRSWYVKAWVGGDPGLRVTQAAADLQQHPLLFKCDQAASGDLSTYASDAYTPWSTGRHRASGMGNGGDHDSIGPLPKWESQALQSGDYRCWNAVEVNALALLGYDINTRHTGGLVPTILQADGKDTAVRYQPWPSLNGFGSNGAMSWESAHQPAVGLMAFIARPSPIFIELAQKVAIVNATATAYVGDGTLAKTGVFGAYQVRAKAWCMRALAHATFLTPSALSGWKSSAVASIKDNFAHLNTYVTDPKAKLNLTWLGKASAPQTEYNVRPAGAAFGTSNMQASFLLVELHKLASARLLSGADQTAADAVADWVAAWPVRFINEQSNGSWRYISIGLGMGRNPNTIDSPATWDAMRAYAYPGQTPPTVAGTWMDGAGWDEPPTMSAYVAVSGGFGYAGYFWSALVAATERNAAGSTQAWNTVQSGITNLAAWRSQFGSDPRWGSVPRNR